MRRAQIDAPHSSFANPMFEHAAQGFSVDTIMIREIEYADPISGLQV